MKLSLLVPVLFGFGLFVLDACSDPAAGATTTTTTPDAAAPPPDAATRDASLADTSVVTPLPINVVKTFDPGTYELAEGLALRDGNAYVSLAPQGRIVKVSPAGVVTDYATVRPGEVDGYTLGLAFDAQGTLYVAQTKNSPTASILPGIYKIPANGDAGAQSVPFATDPSMTFPNGIAFDAQSNLLVTDSASGIVFRVTPAGVVTRWREDVALSGTPPCDQSLPFPIGANGIVRAGSDVYVTNTAAGSIVRIAVAPDGSAGAVTKILASCKYVGLDGLAVDTDGSLLVAQNGAPGRILRVTIAGDVTVLHDGAPLDGPGSIALSSAWNGHRAALVTSTAFFSVGVDGGAPKPALLDLTLP